eukprot:m.89119 g.89119  ORF g.89119 m.89119 type:complete len:98 (-) comp12882_c0_seq1:1118-1411(-)
MMCQLATQAPSLSQLESVMQASRDQQPVLLFQEAMVSCLFSHNSSTWLTRERETIGMRFGCHWDACERVGVQMLLHVVGLRICLGIVAYLAVENESY